MATFIIREILIVSILAFAAYGIDKWKAVNGDWRISEAVLILLAVCGGAPGALLGMLVFRHKIRKWKFLLIVPVFTVIQILLLVMLGWSKNYYHADKTALAAMESDAQVTVEKEKYGWLFDGPSEDKTMIFYPGAKVEETAYAPLLCRLAENGVDVYLVKMPLHLAIFGKNRAGKIIDRYEGMNPGKKDGGKVESGEKIDASESGGEVEIGASESGGKVESGDVPENKTDWYIGGHSLGGAMAAAYAADHSDQIDGVIMLAAYPTKELDADMKSIIIYGSEDQVLNQRRLKKSLRFLPDDFSADIITGGNHAQFGDYGSQKGDGQAAISAQAQQEATVEKIAANIMQPNSSASAFWQ